MTQATELQELLCEQWCASADIAQDQAGLRLSLPLEETDGDAVTVWLNPEVGGWSLRDCGTTMMRLSYDMDPDLLLDGPRAKVLERILGEHQVRLEEGELRADAEERQLGAALMRFGQAALRIGDIKLWSKVRVASTFYDDLASQLSRIVGSHRLVRDYEVPGLSDAKDYTIDFALPELKKPFYVFGVPSADKAKLANIVLLHLRQAGHQFDSLVVPSDIDSIGRPNLRRLMNAANDVVDSITSTEALERKVRERLSA